MSYDVYRGCPDDMMVPVGEVREVFHQHLVGLQCDLREAREQMARLLARLHTERGDALDAAARDVERWAGDKRSTPSSMRRDGMAIVARSLRGWAAEARAGALGALEDKDGRS